nr:hypothetical protein [Mesorhizobium sp.]
MSDTAIRPAPAMRGLTPSDEGRADHWYRFTVKCGRADNARLEAMARREKVSVTALVQRHFETLLSVPRPAAPGGAFDAAEFAQRHGVPLPAARVYGALCQMMGEDGRAVVKHEPLATAACIAISYLARCIDALEMRDLVVRDGFRGVHGTAYLVRQVP